jgi:pyruvate dehydrogenase E2 component (dihydrolipoyllysine-residue acetyltransferase)
MPTNVIMPALGVAQQKGTLLKWLKAEGQSVSKGEPLMEIETDKATVEIEAPGSGVLTQIVAKPGDEVPVGKTIALLLAPGESESAPALQHTHHRIASEAGSDPHPNPVREGEEKSETQSKYHPLSQGEGRGEGRPASSARVPPVEPSIPMAGVRVLSSPAARRIAKEKGVNLASLRGSGPEGSILAEDVLRATELQPAAEAPKQEVLPLSPMRRIVGQRMTQSKQSAPHFYISMDIDMTAVNKLRTEWKEQGADSAPSINDIIVHACARALKDFPSVNSTFTEQGIKLHKDINIGIAVALEEGLVVPVVRNADRLSLSEMAAQSRELIDKAQKKKLFPLDYEGGTFTVSNLGTLGVDSFIAIINPPQCAILAVGRVAPRVVAENDMFSIKPFLTATLSADHRVVDGAIAARFLREVKELLEGSDE